MVAGELALSNPINAELDIMRPSPLSNLVRAAAANADKGMSDIALFETGPGFLSCDDKNGQILISAGVRFGRMGGRHWEGAHASRESDIFDVKADVLAVLDACGAPVESLQTIRPLINADNKGNNKNKSDKEQFTYYHSGRSACLRLGKNLIAVFGEIHPGLLENMGIKGRINAFEIYPQNIPVRHKKSTTKPLLRTHTLQPVNRDLAFILDSDISAEELVRTVRAADKKMITDAYVFDVYSGKGIDEGKKSLAVSFTLQPQEVSLTDEEIEKITTRITDSVAAKLGGILR